MLKQFNPSTFPKPGKHRRRFVGVRELEFAERLASLQLALDLAADLFPLLLVQSVGESGLEHGQNLVGRRRGGLSIETGCTCHTSGQSDRTCHRPRHQFTGKLSTVHRFTS